MRRTTRAAGGLVVWGCCVAGVATGSWVAIDSAGRQVSLAPVVDSDDPSPMIPTGSGGPTSPAAGTAIGGAATAPVRPTESNSAGRPTGAASGSTAPSTTPTRTASAPPPPAPIVDSVHTRGGVVELECTGAAVSGYNAQPADGWTGHVKQTGTSTIEADFHRGSTEIEVRGSCTSGAPKFSVSTHDDDEH